MAVRKPLMPPPGKKPDLVVAIGVGKKKPGSDGQDGPMGVDADPDPDKTDDDLPSAGDGGGPGAGSAGADETDPDNDGDDDSGKMDPAKALVSHADENCGNCNNYDPSTGDCSKVSGTFAPTDRCWSAYSAMGSGDTDNDAGIGMPGAMSGTPAGM
jgi:hypothetical protein